MMILSEEETKARKEEAEFIIQKGLILWIPKEVDSEIIEAMLSEEIRTIEVVVQTPNKKMVLDIFKTAKLHFSGYPNRILCFNERSFSWRNPIEEIEKTKYWFNV